MSAVVHIVPAEAPPGVRAATAGSRAEAEALLEPWLGGDGLPADRLVPGLRADLPVPGALDLRLDCTATQALLRTRLRGAREFLATG